MSYSRKRTWSQKVFPYTINHHGLLPVRLKQAPSTISLRCRGKQSEIEARNWLQSDWVCIHSDNYSSDVINLIFSQNGFRSIVPRTKELNSLKIYANFHQNWSRREGKTGVVSIISEQLSYTLNFTCLHINFTSQK